MSKNGGNGPVGTAEEQARRLRGEIVLLEEQVQQHRTALGEAERLRRIASENGDDSAVAKYSAQATRARDSIDLLEDRLRPLVKRSDELARAVNEEIAARARCELDRAQARAESELRDTNERLRAARTAVADLETKANALQTRLQLLKTRDSQPGAAPLDADATLRRAGEYAAVAVKDDRPIIELKDGRRGRFIGHIGFDHDSVVELESHERITVKSSEIVAERAAVAV